MAAVRGATSAAVASCVSRIAANASVLVLALPYSPVAAADVAPRFPHATACDLQKPTPPTTAGSDTGPDPADPNVTSIAMPSPEPVIRAAALIDALVAKAQRGASASAGAAGVAIEEPSASPVVVIVLVHRVQAAAVAALLLAALPLPTPPTTDLSDGFALAKPEHNPAPPSANTVAWLHAEVTASSMQTTSAIISEAATLRYSAACTRLPPGSGDTNTNAAVRWLAALEAPSLAVRAGTVRPAALRALETAAPERAAACLSLQLPAVPGAVPGEVWHLADVALYGLPQHYQGTRLRPFVMLLHEGQVIFTSLTAPGGVRELAENSRETCITVNRPVAGDLVLRLYHLPAGARGQLLATAATSSLLAVPTGSAGRDHRLVLRGADLQRAPNLVPVPGDCRLELRFVVAAPPPRTDRLQSSSGQTASAAAAVAAHLPGESDTAQGTVVGQLAPGASPAPVEPAAVQPEGAATALDIDTSSDEAYARALQAMFDQEVNDARSNATSASDTVVQSSAAREDRSATAEGHAAAAAAATAATEAVSRTADDGGDGGSGELVSPQQMHGGLEQRGGAAFRRPQTAAERLEVDEVLAILLQVCEKGGWCCKI